MNKNAIDDDDNVTDDDYDNDSYDDDDDNFSYDDDNVSDDHDDDEHDEDNDRPSSRYLNFSCSFHRSDKSRTDREYSNSILLTQ